MRKRVEYDRMVGWGSVSFSFRVEESQELTSTGTLNLEVDKTIAGIA